MIRDCVKCGGTGCVDDVEEDKRPNGTTKTRTRRTKEQVMQSKMTFSLTDNE